MKWIVLPLLLLPLFLVVALVLMIDEKPMLFHRADLTPERIARGKQVFEQNDPRRLKAGVVTEANLAEQDLDLAINYFANQTFGGMAGVDIENGRALIDATLKLPSTPLGGFLNLKLELRQTEQLPRIDHLQLGRLWVPGFLVERLLNDGVAVISPSADWQALAQMIRQIKFEFRRMTITYRWRDDLPGKLSDVLWSEQDRKRLAVYQGRLAELTQDGERSLNASALLRPLFQLANERSGHGEAVAENRALILVLAFYVNQKDLNKLILSAKAWPRPLWRTVTLSGRDDFSKHYLVSAMLAAYAKTPLANAVGLYKEVEDAHGGSGFSFNDIAADRAGARMGELATAGEMRAKAVQRLMAEARESDFMPVTADLPEFMPEAEFKHRFGGLQGEKYLQMMAGIERRIEDLPINESLR